MPSSISNSNDRLKHGTPRRVWFTCISVAILVLLSIEGFWRFSGYRPTLIDDWSLWCTQRDQLETADNSTVVLLGHSRMHQSFVPSQFKNDAPDREFLQLAIFNAEPLVCLQDIALNTQFAGTIVCTFLEYSLLSDAWLPTEREPYRTGLVNYYHQDWGPKLKIDRWFSNLIQSSSVLSSPELAPHEAFPDIVRGEWPPQWVWTNIDRTQRVDYRGIDFLEEYKKIQLSKLKKIIEKHKAYPSYENWPDLDALKKLDGFVQRIQSRGGKVLFIRPTTSGDFHQEVIKSFPRERFWDVFATNTSAQTIHFEDIPELASFECADGSHLFHDDAKTFTSVLVRELKQRDML